MSPSLLLKIIIYAYHVGLGACLIEILRVRSSTGSGARAGKEPPSFESVPYMSIGCWQSNGLDTYSSVVIAVLPVVLFSLLLFDRCQRQLLRQSRQPLLDPICFQCECIIIFRKPLAAFSQAIFWYKIELKMSIGEKMCKGAKIVSNYPLAGYCICINALSTHRPI